MLRVHACGEKEVVRELENDQHVSLKANIPFYFLQSFWDLVLYL